MPSGSRELGAVVLAGGFGTRVSHLLPGIPKPMAPVLGRPFLDWILAYLGQQGIRRVLISTGHLGEVIERHFAGSAAGSVEVQCVREEAPLGTAGGFLHAQQRAKTAAGHWIVLNGDSLVVTSIAPLLDVARKSGVGGALLGVEVDDASRYGTLEADEAARLLEFREKRPGRGLVNAGVYLLDSSLAASAPAKRPLSFETDWFPHLIAKGVRLEVVKCRAPFLDIGTPGSLRQAEDFVRVNSKWF